MTHRQPQDQPGNRAGQPPATPPQWGPPPQGAPQQWVPLEQRPGYGPPQAGWQPPQPPQPPQYPPPQYQPPRYAPPPRKKSRVGLFAGLGCGGLAALVILIVAIAAASSSSSSAPAAGAQQTRAAAPAASKAAAAGTVTYEVTGSAADVTYGPAGSDYSGTVPLHVTKPIATPVYYSISAQLQGGGTVSCKILVGGKVISQSTASGGYNIASCEISQGFTGGWQDTNG